MQLIRTTQWEVIAVWIRHRTRQAIAVFGIIVYSHLAGGAVMAQSLRGPGLVDPQLPALGSPVVAIEEGQATVEDSDEERDLSSEFTEVFQRLMVLANSPSPEHRKLATRTLELIQQELGDWPYAPGRQIYLMNADGSNLRCFSGNPTKSFGSPRWSPDGNSLAYDAWPAGRPFWESSVYTVALDGSYGRNYGNGAMPEWAADQGMLLIHTYPGSAGRIVAIDLRTGARRNILNHQGSNPRVSPNGKRLVFIDRDREIKFWDVAPEFQPGLRSVTLTPDWTPLTGLSWSSNNRHIACVRQKRDSLQSDLVLLSTNSEDPPLQVLASGDIHRVVSWHPTKNVILYSSKEKGASTYQLRLSAVSKEKGASTYQLRLFDVDEGSSRPLPNQHPLINCLEMCWSPDGQQIVFIGELP